MILELFISLIYAKMISIWTAFWADLVHTTHRRDIEEISYNIIALHDRHPNKFVSIDNILTPIKCYFNCVHKGNKNNEYRTFFVYFTLIFYRNARYRSHKIVIWNNLSQSIELVHFVSFRTVDVVWNRIIQTLSCLIFSKKKKL